MANLFLMFKLVIVGSKFSIYVNSIENNGELFLTLATKPAPILNYPSHDDSASSSEKTKCKYRYLIIIDLVSKLMHCYMRI